MSVEATVPHQPRGRTHGLVEGVFSTVGWDLVRSRSGWRAAKSRLPQPTKPEVKNNEPNAGSNAAAALMAAQEPLVKLAESISKLSQSAEGLGGIQLDVPRRSFTPIGRARCPMQYANK